MRNRVVPIVGLLLAAQCLHARDIYVDPNVGADAADGTSGPVKTIARAVRLAGPGDTVHLAKTVYYESVDLTGKSGDPASPLVIDGHDAVIEGSRPIDPADWKEVAPGLYRNTKLFDRPLRRIEEWVWRWFFLVDGKMSRMGRCMKGTNAPYKRPSDLRPGEWTYQQKDDHAFYIRIDRKKRPADCRVAAPWLVNGVSVHGSNHDVVIRNLTATHVLNDGYNISPTTDAARIHSVLFENIRAIECGDDGLSAHGNSTVRVDGFHSTGNGTGVCTTGNSINNRLLIKDNVGFEVFFYPYPYPGRTAHVITNSRIDCRADNGFLVQGGKGPDDICTLTLRNVVIVGHPGGTPNATRLRIAQRARLEGRYLTVCGHTLTSHGHGTDLVDSVLAGGSGCSIEVGANTAWKASRNVYDLAHIRIGPKTYVRSDLSAYRQATRQDAASTWQTVDTTPILGGATRLAVEGDPVGARVSLVPK